MRIIYTILLLSVSFSSISQAPANTGAMDSSYRFKTVCLPVKSATEVLYVIDGVPEDESALRRLDPSLIESISIFKDSATRFYSCRPLKPVILINTRRSNNLQITIRDKDDQAPLPGATVSFISSDRRDTLMYVADLAGQVSRKNLKKDKKYDVQVTSSGYKIFAGPVASIRNGVIEVERDIIMGQEVVVSSGHVIICRRYYACHQLQTPLNCCVQTRLINDQRSEIVKEPLGNSIISVFPNPVQRGQQVSLKLSPGYFPSGSIRVITMDGKQVLSVPVNGSQKQGLIQVSMQQSWTPGVYIFQLVYANGRPGASEKVILQ